jgi:hypothetical protein
VAPPQNTIHPSAHPEWCDGNGSADCPDCGGQGGWHDCGEDCCACLEPEDNVSCSTCEGRGLIVCPICHDGSVPEWAEAH